MNKDELEAIYKRVYQPGIEETEDLVDLRRLLWFVSEMRVRASGYPAAYRMLRQTCKEFGYALGIHGSQANDLDLVAVPWIEEANTPEELLKAIRFDLGTHLYADDILNLPEQKPHGRLAWTFHTSKKEYGIGKAIFDISIMPRLSKKDNQFDIT